MTVQTVKEMIWSGDINFPLKEKYDFVNRTLEGVITHAVGIEDLGDLEHPALQDVPEEAPPDADADPAAADVPSGGIQPADDDHVAETHAARQPDEVTPPDDTVPDSHEIVTADEVPSPGEVPPLTSPTTTPSALMPPADTSPGPAASSSGDGPPPALAPKGPYPRRRPPAPKPPWSWDPLWKSYSKDVKRTMTFLWKEEAEEFRRNRDAARSSATPAVTQNPYAAPAMPVANRPSDYKAPHRERNPLSELPFTACVARPVSAKEIRSTDAAQKAMDKEWQNLCTKKHPQRDKIGCWDEHLVEEAKDVRGRAQQSGSTAHFGTIFGICVEKGSELPADHKSRKFKGR